ALWAMPKSRRKPAGHRPTDPQLVPVGTWRRDAAEAPGQAASPCNIRRGIFIFARARHSRLPAGADCYWRDVVSETRAVVSESRLATVSSGIAGLRHCD